MRGSESGTSIVQVRAPEFKSVNLREVKKKKCIVGVVRGDAARGVGGNLRTVPG